MKNDLSGVKVGDRLWSVMYGWGEVIHIATGTPYPIEVRSGNTYTESNLNGEIRHLNKFPTLFWDEIKFDYPKKPLPDLAVDTRVLVWEEGQTAKMKRHFKEFNKHGRCVCFYNGQTSHSNMDGVTKVWDNYEIYEEEK